MTIAKRPSCEHGTVALMEFDLGETLREFCGEDWTGNISLIGFGKSADWYKGERY
jgi:hypothetical protein